MLKDKDFHSSRFGLPQPTNNVSGMPRSRFRCRPGDLITLLLTVALVWTMIQKHKTETTIEYVLRDSKAPSSAPKEWGDFDQIFAFGDSYTAYFYEERNKDPPFLINKMKEGSKFRMKPNWISFLIEQHNQSTIQTVNFAEGGSAIDHDIVKPGGFGTSLKKQVEGFADSYNNDKTPALPWSSETTLFLAWFGINDILGTYMAQGSLTKYVPLDLEPIFKTYHDSLQKLYNLGARNFIVLTVPPFDRATNPLGPEDVRRALVTNYVRDIASLNARLYEMIGNFKILHDDVDASVFDAHRLYARVLDDPLLFEETSMIQNPVELCWDETKDKNRGVFDVDYEENICTNGDLVQHYAWNVIHATYPLHNVTAAKLAQDCFGERRPGSYCS